ncbi:hypothetical protein KAM344_41590 [Aeromonas caviae]|nr:hypothetical protein KAM353_44100 [Aeromonas caviae]GJB05327.1 hypothetical protein KAM360_42700 [Aeromonas caviae]GKQ68994.1 hypothetical protein KAM344_41590 [Aeromonas caviae]
MGVGHVQLEPLALASLEAAEQAGGQTMRRIVPVELVEVPNGKRGSRDEL